MTTNHARSAAVRRTAAAGAVTAAISLCLTVHVPEAAAEPVESFPGCPVLVEGTSTGPCVERLQRALNRANSAYDLKVSGDFDAPTRIAVLDHQGRTGLPADGNVGPQTAASLSAKPSPTPRTEKRPSTTPRTESEFFSCVAKAGEGVWKVKKLKKVYQLYKQGASKATLREVATGLPLFDVAKIFWCLRLGPN